MSTATLKATPEIINIISGSDMDETGLTLQGQLDRNQYTAVNKFLELAGAKWNKGKKRHIFEPGAKARIDALLGTGEIVDEKKQLQKFYTPKEVAEELVSFANVYDGTEVLEPSAGGGSIALAARKAGAKVFCVEIDPVACNTLRNHGFDVAEKDFLQIKPEEASQWEYILMNPPFTKDQDIKHVMHAHKFLLPHGKLYAIMSPGFQYGETKIRKEFRQFVEEHGSVIKELDAGAFKESGTMVRTVIVELSATA